jgi:uncharacterized protein YqgQ
MDSTPDQAALDRRFLAIEKRLDEIEFMLRDMREIFTQGYDVLSKANDNRRTAIEELRARSDERFGRVGSSLIEIWDHAGYVADKLRATYAAVFPGRMNEMRDEIDRALRRPKGQG